jgi:hypothetical protein
VTCRHGNTVPGTCPVCSNHGIVEVEIDDAMITQGEDPNAVPEDTTPLEMFPGAAALADQMYQKGKVEALGAMVDCLIEKGVELAVAVEAAKCAANKMGGVG